jgi:hypothetical protein
MTQPLSIKNFEIKRASVKLHNGQKFDIDNASILGFEYAEGILQKYITVTLKIADTTSMLSQGMIGLEQVELVVRDVLNDVKLEFTGGSTNGPLYVYEIHDKMLLDTGKTFVLELCRLDAINNHLTKISKKYESQKSGALVGDVLGSLGSKKPQNVTASMNTLTFVPPNSKPYEVLVWARNKYVGNSSKGTKSGGGFVSAGYLFYEDYDQYNFVSIDSLAEQRKEAARYSTGTDLGGTDKIFKLENPQFVKNLDLIQNFDKGFYSGQVDFLDLVNLEVYTGDYNISDNYSKWSKLGSQDDLPDLYKKVLSKSPTRIMTIPYNDDLFLESGNQDKTKNKMYMKETIVQSVSRFGVFTSQVLKASCLGNMTLRAGNMIIIEFVDPDGKQDKTYSGRYVISDIRHIYSGSYPEAKLKTNLTLVRDSFGA